MSVAKIRRGDKLQYRIIGEDGWRDAEIIEVHDSHVTVRNRNGHSWDVRLESIDNQLYRLVNQLKVPRVRLVDMGDHYTIEPAGDDEVGDDIFDLVRI